MCASATSTDSRDRSMTSFKCPVFGSLPRSGHFCCAWKCCMTNHIKPTEWSKLICIWRNENCRFQYIMTSFGNSQPTKWIQETCSTCGSSEMPNYSPQLILNWNLPLNKTVKVLITISMGLIAMTNAKRQQYISKLRLWIQMRVKYKYGQLKALFLLWVSLVKKQQQCDSCDRCDTVVTQLWHSWNNASV